MSVNHSSTEGTECPYLVDHCLKACLLSTVCNGCNVQPNFTTTQQVNLNLNIQLPMIKHPSPNSDDPPLSTYDTLLDYLDPTTCY